MARNPNSRLVYSTGGDVERAEPKPSAAAPRPGKGGIRLRLERRAAGRMMTVVTGLPKDGAEELARALRRACHAGGSFRDGVLELQGDQREGIEAELAARGLASKRAGPAIAPRSR